MGRLTIAGLLAVVLGANPAFGQQPSFFSGNREGKQLSSPCLSAEVFHLFIGTYGETIQRSSSAKWIALPSSLPGWGFKITYRPFDWLIFSYARNYSQEQLPVPPEPHTADNLPPELTISSTGLFCAAARDVAFLSCYLGGGYGFLQTRFTYAGNADIDYTNPIIIAGLTMDIVPLSRFGALYIGAAGELDFPQPRGEPTTGYLGRRLLPAFNISFGFKLGPDRSKPAQPNQP